MEIQQTASMTHAIKGKCRRKKMEKYLEYLLILLLFVAHLSMCNGHKLLNRTRYEVSHPLERKNDTISLSEGHVSTTQLRNNTSSANIINSLQLESSDSQPKSEIDSWRKLEMSNFVDFFLRKSPDRDFRSGRPGIPRGIEGHSRSARGTIEAWRGTTYLGQPMESLKLQMLSLLDNYVPRSVLLKLANFLASYRDEKGKKKLDLTLAEREYLVGVIDKLEGKLDEVTAKNLSTVFHEVSLSLPTSPKLMKSSFDFLTSKLLSRLEKKNEVSASRQTPFGIVNFFLGFLSDPIVLGLFIALNVWIVFWGFYTFAFGSGFFFFPGLLGFGGGGGGGGGGAVADPPPPVHVPITPANVVIITAATEEPTPTTETSTEVSTTPDLGKPISLNYPFLQACLSLGGNKAKCVAQAYLYAQVLQGPLNNSILMELFGGSQGSNHSHGGSYGSHGSHGGSYGSQGGSHPSHGGSYSKPKPVTENPNYKPSETTPNPDNLFGGSIYPPVHTSSPAPPPQSLITFIPPPIDSGEFIPPLPPLILGGTTSQTGLVAHYPYHTSTTVKPYVSSHKPYSSIYKPYPPSVKPYTVTPEPAYSTYSSYLSTFRPYPTFFKPYTTYRPYHTSSLRPFPPSFQPYPPTEYPIPPSSYKPNLPSGKPYPDFPSPPSVKPPNYTEDHTAPNGNKPSLADLIMAIHPHAVIVPVNNNQIDKDWKENLKK